MSAPLTRVEWISNVAAELGYPGQMPYALYLRIEALQLTGIGSELAVKQLRGAA